jgi:hypothetical protein
VKLEELFYFAQTHDVRAVAKGKDPGTKSTTYYLVIDQFTTPFAEEVKRFEHEHNAAGLQMLPFRNYHGQGTEIWREAKLSPANIEEELIAFAKQHPDITEVRKRRATWFFLSPLRTYKKKFFHYAPLLASVSQPLSRRGADIELCYGSTYTHSQVGTRVWKRKLLNAT